jgi:hypothetical protein
LAKAAELGEDVPHPVGGFASAVEFAEHARVDGILGVDETLEVEWIVVCVRHLATLPS